jgi:hypothetical protein
LSFWDQFGDDVGIKVPLSVLRKVQRDNAGVRKGTGLCGLDETGTPQLSIEEEMRSRYLELLDREKGLPTAKVSGGDGSR